MAIVMRGVARYCLGQTGWKDDIDGALAMADQVGELTGRVGIRYYTYLEPIVSGVLMSNTTVLRDTADTLAATEQVSDDFQLLLARVTRGA